jgi:hypothetical protein
MVSIALEWAVLRNSTCCPSLPDQESDCGLIVVKINIPGLNTSEFFKPEPVNLAKEKSQDDFRRLINKGRCC